MIEIARTDQLPALFRGRAPSAPPLGPIGWGTRSEPLPAAVEPLSLARLAGIEEFDVEEMVMTALSGTPVEVAARAALEVGLMLCPLLPVGMHGTLGGLYASGEESPAAPGEGRIRDAVLGIEGVTGDGDTLRGGGRVVKNVTGYDLTRFLSGSRGTLAVITRMHWRLRRRPECWREVITRRPAREIESLLVAIRAGPDPTALRVDLEGGMVTLHALIEGSEATARELGERIAAGVDGILTPEPIDFEALASWLELGEGGVERRPTRGWCERIAELGTLPAVRAVVHPFIGVGRIEGVVAGSVATERASEFGSLVRGAWDRSGRLWCGDPR